MTRAADDHIHARYRHVLTWRAEGMPYVEIGRPLGVSGQRAQTLERQAQRWQQRVHAPPITPATLTVTAATPIQMLPISAQAKRALWRSGVDTVGQVAALSDAALLTMSGIGWGTVTVLRAYCIRPHSTTLPRCHSERRTCEHQLVAAAQSRLGRPYRPAR